MSRLPPLQKSTALFFAIVVDAFGMICVSQYLSIESLNSIIIATFPRQVLGLTPVGANFLGFNGVVLLVVGDVPVDSETHVVTSSISRIYQPIL
jgi:hypothetical protein